ncbi:MULTISPECIES: O-methyltransferase [Streptomycetaceae]|uniref:O-methyltransferase n=1 Tax=Streptantibioticus cattleyicolor (strain ATCC 35852 / DSM 46488 / JCM 4925 / NBRC 14057 / NRRL 8057) TaxID=1003195 RepID=F8JQK0_STREN|nr:MULTISPECIES: class I SAM-dependent methyltransferase [Streptomycetaceae]AEW97847.1 O-methyltransferase [Streptantibioticus cattleyicolor NRRL 8057 = DSM 46488]MYS62261.1 methyltransferase [Streptomyces sp. SID5468]CCB78166.1 O-methyltransferase [Streptantibioticus cattleyicolor NRRL 8057 = DSM 46488]
MTTTTPPRGLDHPAVGAVLARLYAAADRDDQAVMARAHARAAELPGPPTVAQTTELCADASLPVHPNIGRLLYLLVRAIRPARVVEFGTSFATSTIQLAAALRDNGTGTVTGTELDPGKAEWARANLAEAGLAEYATVLTGDARETLAGLPGPVDLVLLDGWKELYLPVFELLQPKLRPGAVVVADNLPLLPPEFLARVRDRAGGYLSVTLPLGDGIEISTWAGGQS